jgi:hypothetical protein
MITQTLGATPPRHHYKRILITTAVVLVAALAFVSWYKVHYSMGPARTFEVNSPTAEHRVLIATQGSEFKGALVDGIVSRLKPGGAYVKVIDVSELSKIDESAWTAIVLISSWEMRRPEPNVKTFVDQSRSTQKVIIMNTSGRGDFKMEGVDAISGASVMTDVPGRVATITHRIEALFAKK